MKAHALKDAFLRVRELDPVEQREFLTDLAGRDPAMADKLGRMLRVDRGGEGPLEATGEARLRLKGELVAGRYRILERLRSGGNLSHVYAAQDETLHGRRVAVKFPIFAGAGREELIAHFQRETRALASLNHAHVVPIYDSGLSEDGEPFLVMQFIEGTTLRESLGKTSRRLVVARIELLASALDEAHLHGVLHLDIKPSNVMLRPNGEPVLIDFGVALLAAPEAKRGVVVVGGSSGYMAPEHRAGHPVAASDIYSLAVLSWEMITGVRPDPALRANLPPVLRKALDPDAAKRHASASQFASELRRHLDRPRHVLRAAAVGVVCTAVIAGVWQQQRRAPVIELQSFLSVRGSESQPSASRDGNRVAYIGYPDGSDTDVYLWDRGQPQPRRLTRTPLRKRAPAVSPDGQWVAYIREGGSAARTPTLMLQATEGVAAERILLEGRPLQDISWHPNGKWLLAASGDIVAVSRDGGAVRTVYRDGATRQGHPTVSPDGTLLAFTQSPESSRGSLMLVKLSMAPDGAPIVPPDQEPRLLSTQLAKEPVFSWAGGEIFFECGIRICRVGVLPGAQPRVVPFPRFSLRDPFPTPQGLLLSDLPEHTDILVYSRGQERTMPVFTTGVNEKAPSYSPDGRWLAFLSDRSGAKEVWIADPKTLVARQLTAMEGVDLITWSPDSARILAAPSTGDEIVAVAVGDGAITGRWAAPPSGDIVSNAMAWVDRRTVYKVHARGRRYELVRMDLESRSQHVVDVPRVREVLAIPGSGDLLVRTDKRDLLRYSPGSGVSTSLASGVSRYRLTATAQGAYYVRHLSNGESWMFYRGFAGPEPERPLFLEVTGERWGYGLSVSPDGESLLFTRDSRRDADLILAPAIH
ncbi:MAG: PD40 domain-containing protein [Bryobacterales bacterium]|nr:PD40 domain-containing protein [Bryobacterales bacterium]